MRTSQLCGPAPDWSIRAKLAKDKKDKEDATEADRREAVFFGRDENGVRENSASQPPPPPPPPKKKKKTAAQKAAAIEAAQDIGLAEIRAELATAEPYVPDERKPAAQAHLRRGGLGDPCDALAAIYESMYGKVPKLMLAVSVLRA